jgi:hypothetical protein
MKAHVLTHCEDCFIQCHICSPPNVITFIAVHSIPEIQSPRCYLLIVLAVWGRKLSYDPENILHIKACMKTGF